MDVILNENIVPISNRGASIPVEIATVIDIALQKRVSDRYDDAGSFLHAMILSEY